MTALTYKIGTIEVTTWEEAKRISKEMNIPYEIVYTTISDFTSSYKLKKNNQKSAE